MKEKNQNFDMSFIDRQRILQLSVNIFPGIKTVLHLFMSNRVSLNTVKLLFESANNYNKEPENLIPFTIPIIEDINHDSPLDTAIKANDVNLADYFLQGIQHYPFMSCGFILASGVNRSFEM